MAKSQTHRTNADNDVDDVPDRADMGALADTLVEGGRAVLDQFPAVADSARDVLAGAQDQVNGLSDMGIVAASGFALGVSSGLLLAGAPRAILILSMIPVALTLRSAFARGMRPARLINCARASAEAQDLVATSACGYSVPPFTRGAVSVASGSAG